MKVSMDQARFARSSSLRMEPAGAMWARRCTSGRESLGQVGASGFQGLGDESSQLWKAEALPVKTASDLFLQACPKSFARGQYGRRMK